MSAIQLMLALHDRGVTLDLVDDRIRIRGPKGLLGEKVLEALRQEEAEIRRLLQDPVAFGAAAACAIFDGEIVATESRSELESTVDGKAA